MRIHHNTDTINEQCVKYDHLIGNHDMTTTYGVKTINSKRELCSCDGQLSIA